MSIRSGESLNLRQGIRYSSVWSFGALLLMILYGKIQLNRKNGIRINRSRARRVKV